MKEELEFLAKVYAYLGKVDGLSAKDAMGFASVINEVEMRMTNLQARIKEAEETPPEENEEDT